MTSVLYLTGKPESSNGAEVQQPIIFDPQERRNHEPAIRLPNEIWLTILESTCTFSPDIFSEVMLNLIKNPNITSSHLFRADVFYDSDSDLDFDHGSESELLKGLAKHMNQEYRPIPYELPGYHLSRTIVRQLVPRNPQMDQHLVQTCHFFSKVEESEEHTVVVYIPHVQDATSMPFYHPAVARLAFMHKWQPAIDQNLTKSSASTSISYCLFEKTQLSTRLERTALRLLETVHKHGQGQLAGYEKRVHHDQIIPQKRYQDTYTKLKSKYGKQLSDQWVEVTDPGKHVFEDIGIAAFLIELWRDMYPEAEEKASAQGSDDRSGSRFSKRSFPGFVDIGCGNGILVYILIAEGYNGWGFDARERKTWGIFPEFVRTKLQRRILVPSIFETRNVFQQEEAWHDGTFDPGTFIISNHADELTAWTPLLAYLNRSNFIAIPCCSHDLTGARFRAPLSTKAAMSAPSRLPQQSSDPRQQDEGDASTITKCQAAETGSLKRTEAQKKMPSAYSTLCSYVTSLAEEVGFLPEKEALRIPSTRNQCVIGRVRDESVLQSTKDTDRMIREVEKIVEGETGKSVSAAGADWSTRAEKLAKKPGSGH